MTIRALASLAAALSLAAIVADRPAGAQATTEDALVKKARAIHERVIALDTHDDINTANFTAERNYTQRLDNQVNLPKMVEGGLDAAFFIVYVGQGPLTQEGYDTAYKSASEKFDAIHRLTKELAPDKIELALTSADVRRINGKGKKVALIGVENGYSLGDEKTAVARVREFHQRGARYLSLAHNGHSQLADSNNGEASGEWLHKGLSPLGRQVIEELNRAGIMVDISHPSKDANLQAIALSKAPVIASHSGARALCNHSRNLDDELLLALKKNGGVAQAVALGSYVKTPPPASAERVAALNTLAAEFGLPEGSLGRGGRGLGGGRGRGAAAPGATGAPGAAGAGQGRGRGGALAQLGEEKRAEIMKRIAEVDTQFPPPPRATVKDFVDHIDYIVKKIGIDHVGISSDFDGGGGVEGWNGAEETFNVTLELVRRGYTEQQIAKIWSGNLLRVMDEVQKIGRELQKGKS
jgi:membrane dipeptidase